MSDLGSSSGFGYLNKLCRRWFVQASLIAASIIPGYRALAQSTEQAWTYFKAQDYDRAILEFNKVLLSYPDLSDALDGLGWSYYWRGDYDAAEQAFLKALRRNAEDKSALEGITEVKKKRYSDFSAAWNLFYEGSYQQAATKFLEVLKDSAQQLPYDDQWKIHSGLGWSYYYLQNYKAAQDQFSTLLSMSADNAYGLKGLGYVLFQLGRYEDSIGYLRKALTKEPTWLDAIAMIGWDHYSLGQYDTALTNFDQALTGNPFLADAAYGKGWTLYRLAKLDEAATAFRTAVKITPLHPSVGEIFKLIDGTKEWWTLYEDYGWSYYYTKMWPEAESTFRYATKKLPGAAGLYLGLGYAYFRLANYHQTIDTLTYYLSLVKDPAPITEPFVTGDGKGENALSDANSIMGWSYYYLKQYDKAIHHFTATITAHPAWADPLSGIAWCHLAKGDLAKAEEHFRKALDSNPNLQDAANGLKEVQQQRYLNFNAAWEAFYAGNYITAKAKFLKAQESESLIDPEDRWKIFSGLGWSELLSGNHQAAFPAFEQALAKSPDNPYVLQGLARAFCETNEYERGMQYLNRIKEADRDNLDIELLKAHCLAKADRYLEAEALYQQIAANWPESAYAYSGLGWVYARQDKWTKAKEQFHQALKLAPNLVEALDGLATVEKQETKGQ